MSWIGKIPKGGLNSFSIGRMWPFSCVYYLKWQYYFFDYWRDESLEHLPQNIWRQASSSEFRDDWGNIVYSGLPTQRLMKLLDVGFPHDSEDLSNLNNCWQPINREFDKNLRWEILDFGPRTIRVPENIEQTCNPLQTYISLHSVLYSRWERGKRLQTKRLRKYFLRFRKI